MSRLKLIIRSFLFYRRKNLVLAIGVAISTAVITGSLVVGDSVRSSLENQVFLRLGRTTHSMTAGDRFFTAGLASAIQSGHDVPAAPVLMLRGIAVAGGGQVRVPGVQVLGVDPGFDHFAGRDNYYSQLADGEVIISRNLAGRLEVEEGEQVLFRILKASLIPMNAPFVAGEETSRAVRVTVKGIAGDDELGRFGLRNSQTSPLNAFFSLDYLNSIMELENRANLVLIEEEQADASPGAAQYAGSMLRLADYGLDLHYLKDQEVWELSSERVFIESGLLGDMSDIPGGKDPVFTYFVNSFKVNNNESPYSFVSSLDDGSISDDEILISSWLAEDLNAATGDSLDLEYFVVGPLRELEERSSAFIIAGVFDMDDPLADSTLMPFLPGLSDAGNCRDWETGIPIDLKKIRDKDEDYWEVWRGTPKAFVSARTAKSLWSSRFGEATAIRFQRGADEGHLLESEILARLSPGDVGFSISASQYEGRQAAVKGTDFGQLFLGLSFFLLLAGVILTVVLFRLGIESRSDQLGTFAILGFSRTEIRKILLSEGLLASIAGLIIGLALTVLYNKLIFYALNNAWNDIVRSDALQLYFRPLTLAAGLIISMAVILLSLHFTLTRFLRIKLIELHRKSLSGQSPALAKIKAGLKWISLLAGISIVAWQFMRGLGEDPGLFFAAGGLLLVSFLLFADGLFSLRKKGSAADFSIGDLSIRNGVRNRSRSLSVIILFALGVFLVVTTGANRKDPYAGAGEKTSGTGGFQFIAETTIPVLQNLNREEARLGFGLEEPGNFVQFRRNTGDDASCLNLNRIAQPAILGVDPQALSGRFSFAAVTGFLDEADPWSSLGTDPGGGLVPAIADQTVIQWGLGLKVGDTLFYNDEQGAEMKLLLIGGLANSVFQGHVIISNEKFLKHFPSSSGSVFFLIDGIGDVEAAETELSRGLRDFGWYMQDAPGKLAEFNSVENTYLSIFLILGALGLLLGTVGLGVILARNLLERRQELALLKALGYSTSLILKIIMNEYLGLLVAGLLAGGVSAFVAVLPGLLKPHSDVSPGFLALVVGLILLNGVLWIWLLALGSLRKPGLAAALRNE